APRARTRAAARRRRRRPQRRPRPRLRGHRATAGREGCVSKWILVAEDERALGEMLCDNLSLESYHAEHVLTGTKALERMGRGGIDLLILDAMLPGIDGFEVLRQLRARGDHTPVLILSARSADLDRIRGLELQAD